MTNVRDTPESTHRQTLSTEFLSGAAPSASLRGAFDSALTTLAKANPRIVGLSADLASSAALQTFAKTMGRRYIEVGVAEQNLVATASGLARAGYIPFAASYAVFSPGRNWEQIRTTACLNDQPVKIIGSHAGLNVGADGASHQMLEDIAMMRSLPNMVVLAPGDAVEAAAFAALMIDDPHPNYLRLPRCNLPTYNQTDAHFAIGPAYTLWRDDGATLGIIATGSMTGQALGAARQLRQKGIPVEVVHVPTIKPLDRQTILRCAGRVDTIVTVEEHQLSGGFGELIASTLLDAGVMPQHFWRLGVQDEFGQSGTAGELWQHYGLDVTGIAEQILAKLAS